MKNNQDNDGTLNLESTFKAEVLGEISSYMNPSRLHTNSKLKHEDQTPEIQIVRDNAEEIKHSINNAPSDLRVKVDDLDNRNNVGQHFLQEHREGYNFYYNIKREDVI